MANQQYQQKREHILILMKKDVSHKDSKNKQET